MEKAIIFSQKEFEEYLGIFEQIVSAKVRFECGKIGISEYLAEKKIMLDNLDRFRAKRCIN